MGRKPFLYGQRVKTMSPLATAGVEINETHIVRSITKANFYDFVKEFWHIVIPEKPVWNWHIKYLCSVLQRMAERVFRGEAKLYDLAVNVPPGTSKSTIFSIMFPAWVWTRMPTARVLGASFSHDLSLDLSRKCRDLVKSDLYLACFPEIKLRLDQDTKSYFANTKGGMRYCVGSGGSPMGRHFHFIMIDDPINPRQTVSETVLSSTQDWIDRELSTRKVDARVTMTCLIMQRLHQSDPTAKMLEAPNTRQICIPAEDSYAVKPQALSRYYKDGLMDPVRLPRQVLSEKRRLGSYFYAGQYGQNPVPPEGGMFNIDKLEFSRSPPPSREIKIMCRFWDKAATQGGGAYTVGVKMCVTKDGRVWILHVIRVQLDSGKREKLIEATAQLDGTDCLIGIEQEPGSGGKESAEATAKRLMGYRVRIIKPTGDKVLRADPFSTQVNNSNVTVMVDRGWNHDYLEEMRFFPFSTYMDQIDGSSGCFTIITDPPKRVGGMLSKKKFKQKGRGRSLQRTRLKGRNP